MVEDTLRLAPTCIMAGLDPAVAKAEWAGAT